MKKLLAVVFFASLIITVLTISTPSDGTDYRPQAQNAVQPKNETPTGDSSQSETDSQTSTAEPSSVAPNNSSPPAADTKPVPTAPGYQINVSISNQKVYIYKDGQLVKEWAASTGKNDSTPLGRFTIQNRGQWFFSEKYQEGAKWWVSFKDWGIYLFHSIPMDRDQNIIAAEASLGMPASHGCIRLDIENAKWIYDNIPQGTPVTISQ